MPKPDEVISEAKKLVSKYDKSKYEDQRRDKKSISFKTSDKISAEMHEEATKNDLTLKEYLITLHRTKKGEKITIDQGIIVEKSKLSGIAIITTINTVLLIILILQILIQLI